MMFLPKGTAYSGSILYIYIYTIYTNARCTHIHDPVFAHIHKLVTFMIMTHHDLGAHELNDD